MDRLCEVAVPSGGTSAWLGGTLGIDFLDPGERHSYVPFPENVFVEKGGFGFNEVLFAFPFAIHEEVSLAASFFAKKTCRIFGKIVAFSFLAS